MKTLNAFPELISAQPAQPAQSENSWAALISNGEMADSNFDLIQQAKQEIYLVEFLVRDDDFGLMKLALLRKKAREGIKVHIHVDAFHLLVHPALVKHLMDEGIDFTVFNELSFSRLNKATTRNHCKILIIDGHLLKMGDANTGNEYVHWGEGHQMKSIDVIIEGAPAKEVLEFSKSLIASELSKVPEIELGTSDQVKAQRIQIENLKQIAKTFFEVLQIQMDAPDQFTRPQKVFINEEELQSSIALLNKAEASWAKRDSSQHEGSPSHWKKRPLAAETIRFHADPLDKGEGKHDVSEAIRTLLANAKKRIVIVTPYLLLTDLMRHEVNAALARGVQVSIYTNSLQSTDNKTTQLAYEYHLDDLAALGGPQRKLQIFEFQGPETIHAKFILCDEDKCMVMTYNLDWRSELLNLETAIEFSSETLNDDLEDWLQKHQASFQVVVEEGKVQKILPPTTGTSDLVKRLIIQAIEKQL